VSLPTHLSAADSRSAAIPEATRVSHLRGERVEAHERLTLRKPDACSRAFERMRIDPAARDPLMVFEDRLDIDDGAAADHWEQIQGTNWGNVRFKPPPCSGDTRSSRRVLVHAHASTAVWEAQRHHSHASPMGTARVQA
jgi:hypothetical protein